MRRNPWLIAALVLALPLQPASAQDAPADAEVAPYLDDRSSPEQVVTSLYSAIDRKEYLRAHSYFAPDTAPDFDTFSEGYATTEGVRLRVGTATTDGAAGTIHCGCPSPSRR